jgi:hypothetical protein
VLLETLRVQAERFKAELFEFFRWPMAQVLEDSPLLVAHRDPEDQFKNGVRGAHSHIILALLPGRP